MIFGLIITGASLIGLGQSPLVDPRHEHDWVTLQDQNFIEAVYDRAFKSEFRHDGRSMTGILIRWKTKSGEDEVLADVVMGVDCGDRKMLAMSIYAHKASIRAGEIMRVDDQNSPIPQEPKGPRGKSDRELMRLACDSGGAE